jgi:hypothetical protein
VFQYYRIPLPGYRGAALDKRLDVLPRLRFVLKISDHMTFNCYHDWISSYHRLHTMNNSENSLPPPVPLPPHGFQFIDGPDHHKVLVPVFMVPATKLALEKQKSRFNLKVDEAVPGVRFLIYT